MGDNRVTGDGDAVSEDLEERLMFGEGPGEMMHAVNIVTYWSLSRKANTNDYVWGE